LLSFFLENRIFMYAFFGDKRTNKQMDSTNALSRNIALKFYSVSC